MCSQAPACLAFVGISKYCLRSYKTIFQIPLSLFFSWLLLISRSFYEAFLTPQRNEKNETLDKNYFLGFFLRRKNLLADLYLLLVPFVVALIKPILFSTRKIFSYRFQEFIEATHDFSSMITAEPWTQPRQWFIVPATH